jgi:integrase
MSKQAPQQRQFAFTAKALAALPPDPQRDYIVRDANTPGLALCVTKGGHKSFRFCYTADEFDKRGKRVQKRKDIGIVFQPSYGSLEAARAKVVMLQGELQQQRVTDQPVEVLSPREQRQQAEAERIAAEREAAKHADMGQLTARYLEEHAKQHKRSWKEDERRINNWLLPWVGTRKAKDLTREEIKAELRAIATGDRKHGVPPRPAEANARTALVGKIYSFAVDAELIPYNSNPAVRLPRWKVPPRDRALQTGREFRVFWRMTDPDGYLTQPRPEGRKRYAWRHPHIDPDMAQVLRLIAMTGCRIQEITALRWREVDLDEGHIVLPIARVKNKREHMLPLIEPALALLRQRKEDTGGGKFVFPGANKGGSLDYHRIDRRLNAISTELLPRIGIDKFTPHDLRRTVETGMAAARVPKEYRDRVLNHVDSSVGGTSYNKWDYIDEKREALQKWWARFETLRDAPLAPTQPTNVVPMKRRTKA